MADCVGRILPFSTLILDEIVCKETELLERVVRRMCSLITDAATFICDYAKQSPTSASRFYSDSSLIHRSVVRAMKSAMSTGPYTTIATLQTEFTKLKEDFDRAIDITTLKIARENASKLDAAEESRILDRLKPTATAGYQADRSCMGGTRTALLEHLVGWALKPTNPGTPPNDPIAGNMYWLYGSPGLGKTSVANSLCDRLHGSTNLGGSFFCRRDDPVLREPRRVLPTLISKLAGMWGPYGKLVAQALKDDPQLNPDSKRGEQLLMLLQSVTKPPPRTLVLVIDALDECGDPSTRRSLLRCLLSACSSVSWVKIIITSRPEHDIQTFFDQNSVERRDLGQDDQSRDDIMIFSKKRMALVANNHYLAADWPGEERLKQLVDRSGGLFIFVETVCRYVDDPDPDPLLARVLDGELGEANVELHKLYTTAITSKIGQSLEKFRSFIRAVVVVATYRALPDETLASLMGLEARTVRSWVDRLSSLFYRDASENGGVRVRHLSVLDFLTGPTCPEGFRVIRPQANEEVGLRCLRTMTRELEFNICELETSSLENVRIPNLDKRVKERIPDGLRYSCMYWASHLCAGLDEVGVEGSALLDEFFIGGRPLYWVEVLSLMGQVQAGVLAMRQVKRSIKA